MMTNISSEEQFQAACFQWYNNTYRDKFLFTVDNNISKRVGGYSRVVEGNRKKALGVQTGVTDFIYIGFRFLAFIELKMWNNYQSEEQKAFEISVEKRGHSYYTVKCSKDGDQLIAFKTLMQILKDQDESYNSRVTNKESLRESNLRK